jgi:hypothetical protein
MPSAARHQGVSLHKDHGRRRAARVMQGERPPRPFVQDRQGGVPASKGVAAGRFETALYMSANH